MHLSLNLYFEDAALNGKIDIPFLRKIEPIISRKYVIISIKMSIDRNILSLEKHVWKFYGKNTDLSFSS